MTGFGAVTVVDPSRDSRAVRSLTKSVAGATGPPIPQVNPMPPSPPKLSGAALRKLRALGHPLDPVIAIGKGGLTDAIVAAAESAIATHELVKVKIQREAPVDRHEAGIELAARTGSVLAQVIGRTFLLYRRHPKKPKIVLPAPGKGSKSGKGEIRRPAPETAARGAHRLPPDETRLPPDETRVQSAGKSSAEPVETPLEDDGDPEENP